MKTLRIALSTPLLLCLMAATPVSAQVFFQMNFDAGSAPNAGWTATSTSATHNRIHIPAGGPDGDDAYELVQRVTGASSPFFGGEIYWGWTGMIEPQNPAQGARRYYRFRMRFWRPRASASLSARRASRCETERGASWSRGSAARGSCGRSHVSSPHLAGEPAEPVDAQGLGKELGLDLPPMKISGEIDANLKGDEAMSGTFDILLDGYVHPHPKELDGILHEKKTRHTGKLKAEGDALLLDDLVVQSGGLKLKGKGKLEWAGGGTLTLSLNGSVGCAQLATSVLSSRLGPLAGALGGSVANGHLSGTVGVRIDVATKLKDIKNLSVNPKVSINCGIGL